MILKGKFYLDSGLEVDSLFITCQIVIACLPSTLERVAEVRPIPYLNKECLIKGKNAVEATTIVEGKAVNVSSPFIVRGIEKLSISDLDPIIEEKINSIVLQAMPPANPLDGADVIQVDNLDDKGIGLL